MKQKVKRLEEYRVLCKHEQVRETSYENADRLEIKPKIILFPGVLKDHEYNFQNLLDSFLCDMGYIE